MLAEIELVNPGHEFGYIPFAEPQIAALIELAHGILKRHPIPPARVLGHSDVAPSRKEDPGELFPWKVLAEFGIGLWPAIRASRVPGRTSTSWSRRVFWRGGFWWVREEGRSLGMS